MLVDAGTEGERLVARIRLLLLCLLLLVQAVPSPDPLDNLVGFSLNVLALVIAIVIYFLATYRCRPARTVLAAADARLYEAKHAGRDRVTSGLPRFST